MVFITASCIKFRGCSRQGGEAGLDMTFFKLKFKCAVDTITLDH